MADLPESNEWTPGIYQWETSDPVLGGPEGIDNLPTKQLANRTRWLKDQVEKVISGATAIGKAVKLATARTISVSGAATGSTSFDGSANAAIALTLADSGAVAGSYAKVTINAKGLVVAGSALVAADVPALDWSKIVSGKPATLSGYGIAPATQPDAEGGTENTRPMTALRVFQAIAKVVVPATESAFGWAKVATQTQVNTGADDETIVTPKKLRWGFSIAIGFNGYVLFPFWMGGFLIQWVSVSTTTSGTSPFSWPLQFSETVRAVGNSHSSSTIFGNLSGVTPYGGNADTYNLSGSRVVGNVQIIGVGR